MTDETQKRFEWTRPSIGREDGKCDCWPYVLRASRSGDAGPWSWRVGMLESAGEYGLATGWADSVYSARYCAEAALEAHLRELLARLPNGPGDAAWSG